MPGGKSPSLHSQKPASKFQTIQPTSFL